jgi:peptidoglycan/LPS O-acetylase OafA/YrhL
MVWARHVNNAGTHWLLSDLFPFWSFALYLQNFFMAVSGTFGAKFAAITWSLAIEEQFYLLFPLLVYFCPPRKLSLFLLLFIASAPVIRTLLCITWGNGTLASCVLLPARWDSLGMGALAAWCCRDERVLAWIKAHSRWLCYCWVTASIGIAIMPFFGFTQTSLRTMSFGYLWIALTSGLLLLLLSINKMPTLAALLRNPVLLFFGTISYMLYLVHVAVVGSAFTLFFRSAPQIQTTVDLAAVLVALATSIIIAAGTWHLFEHRLIHLGHRVRYDVSSPITQ